MMGKESVPGPVPLASRLSHLTYSQKPVGTSDSTLSHNFSDGGTPFCGFVPKDSLSLLNVHRGNSESSHPEPVFFWSRTECVFVDDGCGCGCGGHTSVMVLPAEISKCSDKSA